MSVCFTATRGSYPYPRVLRSFRCLEYQVFWVSCYINNHPFSGRFVEEERAWSITTTQHLVPPEFLHTLVSSYRDVHFCCIYHRLVRFSYNTLTNLTLGVFIGLCQMEKDYSRYIRVSQCLRLSVVYSSLLKPEDGSIARRPSFGPAPF
jgi:hypothetical protein